MPRDSHDNERQLVKPLAHESHLVDRWRLERGEGRMHAPIYYLIINTLLASQLILGKQCVNVKGMVSLAKSFAVSILSLLIRSVHKLSIPLQHTTDSSALVSSCRYHLQHSRPSSSVQWY